MSYVTRPRTSLEGVGVEEGSEDVKGTEYLGEGRGGSKSNGACPRHRHQPATEQNGAVLDGKEVVFWHKTRKRRTAARLVNFITFLFLGAVLFSLSFSAVGAKMRSNGEKRRADMYSHSENIYREQIHRRFSVPMYVLNVMHFEVLGALNDRLVGMSSGSEDPPKAVFLHCVEDFGARMEALSFALSYAINTNRALVVLWQRDRFLHPQFSSLFEPHPKFIVVELMPGVLKGSLTSTLSHDWAVINTAVLDRAQQTDENTLMYKHVYIRGNNPIQSKYAPSGHARRLLQDLQPKPNAVSAMSLVRMGQHYGDLSPKQVSAKLHDEYFVPLDFLVGMSVMDQARLLDELVRLKSREAKPRCLFAHVQFGLGNRLRALGSAMAFARKTNRALVVIWERDFHFNATFHDFFVNDLIIADSLHAKWPFDTSRDDAYSHTLLYNHMRKDGKDTIRAGSHHLKDSKGDNIYIKTAYIIKSTFTGSDNPKSKNTPTNDAMRLLVPNLMVQREVDRLEMHGLKGMLGVHIRSRSVEKEIEKVDAKVEYTEEGRSKVNFWRKATQLHVFVEEMHKREVRHGVKYKFFIAADDVAVIPELEKFFPGRIYHVPRRCDDREAECLRYALTDVICLSKTMYILGSFWSSFTEAATRLGGCDVYLAGVDFHAVRGPQG